MKQVVIVGAGIIGRMCAVRLAKAGARVTLLEGESEDLAYSSPTASAAAAGMLAPIEAAPGPHQKLAWDSFDLWKAQQAGAAWADGVRFDGGVVVAADADEAGALIRVAESADREASALSPKQTQKRTGLRTMLKHAVFTPDEGVADPLRVLSGLAMDAKAYGVITEYGADVEAVTATSAQVYRGGVYEADHVVLAPGAWAGAALEAAAPALKHVRPGKGHLVSVALDAPLRPNLRSRDFYLAARRDEIVLGATMEPGLYERHVEQARVDELLAAAEALLPGEVRPAGRAWAGIRPMSPDNWPLIGPSDEGLLLAAGHSRNGWLLAPITAEIIAAYVMGEEIPPEWAALSPQRFGAP